MVGAANCIAVRLTVGPNKQAEQGGTGRKAEPEAMQSLAGHSTASMGAGGQRWRWLVQQPAAGRPAERSGPACVSSWMGRMGWKGRQAEAMSTENTFPKLELRAGEGNVGSCPAGLRGGARVAVGAGGGGPQLARCQF